MRQSHLNQLDELILSSLSSKHDTNSQLDCRNEFLCLLTKIRKCSIQIFQNFKTLQDRFTDDFDYGDRWEVNFEHLRKYLHSMSSDLNWLREDPFMSWMGGVDPYCNPFLLPGIVGGRPNEHESINSINSAVPAALRVSPAEYAHLLQLSLEMRSLSQSWDDSSHQHRLRVLRAKPLLLRSRDSDPVVRFLTGPDHSDTLAARAAQVTARHASCRVVSLNRGFFAWLGLLRYRVATRRLCEGAAKLVQAMAWTQLVRHMTQSRRLDAVRRRSDQAKVQVYWTLWLNSLLWQRAVVAMGRRRSLRLARHSLLQWRRFTACFRANRVFRRRQRIRRLRPAFHALRCHLVLCRYEKQRLRGGAARVSTFADAALCGHVLRRWRHRLQTRRALTSLTQIYRAGHILEPFARWARWTPTHLPRAAGVRWTLRTTIDRLPPPGEELCPLTCSSLQEQAVDPGEEGAGEGDPPLSPLPSPAREACATQPADLWTELPSPQKRSFTQRIAAIKAFSQEDPAPSELSEGPPVLYEGRFSSFVFASCSSDDSLADSEPAVQEALPLSPQQRRLKSTLLAELTARARQFLASSSPVQILRRITSWDSFRFRQQGKFLSS